MNGDLHRRELLKRVGLIGAAGAAATPLLTCSSAAAANSASPPVRYCLNTSTIRGYKLPIEEVIQVTAAAGYDGIEPWIREIQAYLDRGGKLADLKKRIQDAGLTVVSAIGFASWIANDEQRRASGMETMKRDMDLVQQIGGRLIAAPPAGATRPEQAVDLATAAARYRDLLELGREMGVTPQLELWGSSATISRLGELIYVAVESGHPDACVLPDVFHIYKGGSDFAGLNCFSGSAIRDFHMNDYPADPPRPEIRDSQRVYPGDGVAPIPEILRRLFANGFQGMLSLELFNPDYWTQDAASTAKTGLEKMQACVAKSFDA